MIDIKRKAQLLIPSLLIMPTLVIFIYLLYETTKISREKIKTQFALDTAGFVAMQDFTNFLNRTAYINGPFPYRIFKEEWDCRGAPGGGDSSWFKRTDETGYQCKYQTYWEAGDFPSWIGDGSIRGSPGTDPNPSYFDNNEKWEIRYNDEPTELVPHPRQSALNTPNPNMGDELIFMHAENQALRLYAFWDPVLSDYKFYARVYITLGTIEEAQLAVFKRITEDMTFFRKAFYLNAATRKCMSDPNSCGRDALMQVPDWDGDAWSVSRAPGASAVVHIHYVKRMRWWAKYFTGGLPPYEIAKTEPPAEFPDPGLFQLTTIDPGKLKGLGYGYLLTHPVELGSNYFNKDLSPYNTGVRVTVASRCPQFPGDNNCVWPNPTPKYQTRLSP